jgi:hypothetical protein
MNYLHSRGKHAIRVHIFTAHEQRTHLIVQLVVIRSLGTFCE